MKRLALFCAIMLCIWTTPALGGAEYTVTLIDITGATSSTARAVNDLGQVVGSYEKADNSNQAYVWSAAGGTTDIPPLAGDTGSSAHDINNAGQVTGGSINENAMPVYSGFIWSSGGGTQDLGNLGGTTYTEGWGINSNGVVSGESETAAGAYRAIVWTSGSGMADIVQDGFGDDASSSLAINDSGQAALYSQNMMTRTAYIWDSTNGAVALGNIGGTGSCSWDISNSGKVVGWAKDAGDKIRAFIWDSTNGMVQIGSTETAASKAFALNELDMVVGYSEDGAGDGSGNRTAVLWKDGAQVDLNTLIPANSGWVLQTAWDINEKGQIVGYGTYDGKTQAFLLTPVSNGANTAINSLLLLN